jgi:hypothetical protein
MYITIRKLVLVNIFAIHYPGSFLVKVLKNTDQLVSYVLIKHENNSDLSKRINGPNRDKSLEHK